MQRRSIDIGFVPEAETLLARAEKFRTTTLESGAFDWEFTDRGPNVAALREAARLGMTGIEVARDLGGLGFGFREKVRVAEILSRSSIGFAFSLINTQNVTARLSTNGTDRHRDVYVPDLLAGRRFGATALTEPEAGSDFAAITTSAVRTDSGWLLNGGKAWITNAVIADVVLCYAQTDPELGRDGIACFLIDGRRGGFETTDAYRVVSGSTTGVGGFTLDQYEAVEDDLIIGPGAGFRQALLGINGARIYVAAMACSAVRTALGEAVDYGSTRESFGQPILAHQGLSWSLAAVANRLEAAEALTARAVDRHLESQESLAAADTDRPPDHGDELVRIAALAAAHAKKFAGEMVEPALETCMQAMGAEGLRADHAAGRLLSESRILGYVDGTTEMQTERIARSLSHYYGTGTVDVVSVAASTADGAAPAEPTDDRWSEANEPSDDETSPGPQMWVTEPADDASEQHLFDHEPTQPEAAAEVGSMLSDATETMEFEPTGDIAVAANPVSEPPSNVDDSVLPSTPPMPASPPPGEFGGFGESPPPPPPPPTGPPLSTDPPFPPDPPLSTDPLFPPDPPLSTDPPFPTDPPLPTEPPMPPGPPTAPELFAAADDPPATNGPTGLTPPVPPPEFQQVGDSGAPSPPLPGDEHRLELADDEQPSSPPLPPDSMRTAADRGGT